jgi:hypothetical protein
VRDSLARHDTRFCRRATREADRHGRCAIGAGSQPPREVGWLAHGVGLAHGGVGLQAAGTVDVAFEFEKFYL